MVFFTKEELLKHAKTDQNLEIELIKALDLIAQSITYYRYEYSNFLSPSVYELIKKYYIEEDFTVEFIGGHQSSERKVMRIFPYYYDLETEALPFRLIKVEYSEKYSKITHRDILGSVLSLGIKREMLGDIHVHESCAYILVMDSVVDFLLIKLKRVRNSSVRLSVCNIDALEVKEPDYRIYHDTINSNRLDAVISKGFKIDRKSAKSLVNNVQVKVNHLYIDNPHYPVNEDDLISAKGYGRIVLSEINGKTRKNRIKVSIKKVL